MTGHSVYGPSSAHRWIGCPGSIKAEDGIPETESEFAVEGSTAHHLAEVCLTKKQPTKKYINHTFKKYPDNPVDQEMADYVQEYVDYVQGLGGQQEYEQRVSYDDWVPGGFGTADAIVINDETLHVVDLKYGKGEKVDADDNPQGLLYALGALSERETFQAFDKVVIHIHQPRLSHISTWGTTPEYIYYFGHQAKVAAKLTTARHPERVPGEKTCRWCKAKATCSALAIRTENALMSTFDQMDTTSLKPLEELRDEDIRFILNHKKMITDWLKSVEDHVKGLLLNGGTFEGFKLVAGRSLRKWGDESEAETLLKRHLKNKAYTKKLLTVAQAEKALGKEKKDLIKELVIKPEGAPTLVPADDRRNAISPAITADDF